MSKPIAVLFGPLGGSTEKVAKLIEAKLGADKCELVAISEADENTLKDFPNIIFGVSTIGTHTWMHDNGNSDWDTFLPKLKSFDFSKKTVALFGLGDQVAYSNHFVDDLRLVYDVIIQQGAKHIGSWPTEEYDFSESEAVIDNEFVGLAIDEDHQSDFTLNRVNNWVDQIVPLFKL